MDEWFETIVQHVTETPPSCLSGFSVSASHDKVWDSAVRWALACSCGSSKGQLLGHSLRSCNPEYNGPPLFVSPLGFVCSSCGKTTEIIDTKQHGYNSEISKPGESYDSNYRGTGPRETVPCSGCGGIEFSIVAELSHSHFDHIEDEPELEPRAQDYFDGFDCKGTCASCGKASTLVSFELA